MTLKSIVSNSLLLLRTTNLTSCVIIPKVSNYSTQALCCRVVSSYKYPIATYKNTKTSTSSKNGFDESKAKMVLTLNFLSPEDALPFYKLPMKTLVHIYKTCKKDEANGFCKNRLYYISSRIKVPPSVLSEKLAKRTFIYGLSFDWIEKALDVLLGENGYIAYIHDPIAAVGK